MSIISDPPMIASGRVIGQFIVGVVDGDDADDDPDLIGARGSFEFTPTVLYTSVLEGTPSPFTLLREPVVGILDGEGYLCTPSPYKATEAGKRGLRLFSTDAPDSSQVWQWKATPLLENSLGIRITGAMRPFTFYLHANATVDLTTVVGLPPVVS